MAKKILVLSGSPRKDGNTAMLVGWFAEGARSEGAQVEVVSTAFLKYKTNGCTPVGCVRNGINMSALLMTRQDPFWRRWPKWT